MNLTFFCLHEVKGFEIIFRLLVSLLISSNQRKCQEEHCCLLVHQAQEKQLSPWQSLTNWETR